MSQLPSRFILVQNKEKMTELMKKRNFAVLGTVIGSIFFPEDELSNDDFIVRISILLLV